MAIKRLVTHNGSFHGDDLFAAAVLSLMLEQKGEYHEIVRSRDKEIVESGDYVFDVGGEYDPLKNKFDHHQEKGSGKRENGIPYASFGLVWKKFGLSLCDGDEGAWKNIDNRLASPIDAIDNGVDIASPIYEDVFPYSGAKTFLVYAPTWQEEGSKLDDIFKEQVKKVKELLKREIQVAKADSAGRKLILEGYKKSKNKKIVELDNNFPRYLYQDTLSKLPDPVYVIYTGSHGNNWKIEAIHKTPKSFESRKLFPKKWRGFMSGDSEFAKVTGVKDVVFSHKNGFLITTKTKKGAMEIAKKSLKSSRFKLWRS